MAKVFITGVSKGIGRSLAELFLSKGYQVIGIGRSHTISHPSFSFIHCDLSEEEKVQQLDFGPLNEEIILINNAGVIGTIKRLSDQQSPDILNVLTVNSVVPAILCSKIAAAMPLNQKLTVVNISSGAGRRAISSWAAYCASKAALDMLSMVFKQEEEEKGRDIRVYSIAPGVVDTEMQGVIRSTKKIDFSSLDRFLELKEEGQLRTPDEVANRLFEMLFLGDTEVNEVILSL